MSKQFIIQSILALFILIVISSCEKNSTESTGNVPEVITSEVSSITDTSAQCGGTITDDGGLVVTARGICWSTAQNPTIENDTTNDGTGAGIFLSYITGLIPETDYYVKAYATNNSGTGYGSTMSFSTEKSGTGTITDFDGNIYRTIKIGNQWWMAENLKVTHYRNGDPIPNVTVSSTWTSLTTGAYCYYDNNSSNLDIYGCLYNWYAVNDNRIIAPEGWHVPSDSEWTRLSEFLGGEMVAGGRMKETGTTYWKSPNTGATNESGFSALPGGARGDNGEFDAITEQGIWWSSTEHDNEYIIHKNLFYDSEDLGDGYWKKESGFSVRCIRDY